MFGDDDVRRRLLRLTAAISCWCMWGIRRCTSRATASWWGLGPERATSRWWTLLTSSTVLQCRSEGNAPASAYATNATIQLAINASRYSRLYVMAGSLNPVYLGTDSTVTSTGGGNTFFQATTNTPFLYTDTVTGKQSDKHG